MNEPIQFTPMHGIVALGRRIAERLGVMDLWNGEEGIEGVVRAKLAEMGVPEKPIALTGGKAMTPRELAEHTGFIKRRKRLKAS